MLHGKEGYYISDFAGPRALLARYFIFSGPRA
jgi:hypothetical protein